MGNIFSSVKSTSVIIYSLKYFFFFFFLNPLNNILNSKLNPSPFLYLSLTPCVEQVSALSIHS